MHISLGRGIRLTLGLVLLVTICSPFVRAQNILVSDVGSNSVKQFDANGNFIKTFAQGGGLSVPFGMAYGPDGNLYVASLGNSSILEYNGSTGAFISKFISQGVGGLFYPNQIAFGPKDGSLYVSSYSANAVLKYDGPLSGTPGAPSATGHIFASNVNLLGPTGLQFANTPIDNQGNATANGDLFVNSSTNGQIFRFNGTSGSLVGGGAYVNDPVHLAGSAGFTFGANGNLLATSFTAPAGGGNPGMQIASYDTSKPGQPFAGFFTSGAALNGPADVVYNNNDLRVYVTNYNSGTVYRYDAITGAPADSGRPFISSANLINPTYMLFQPTSGSSSPGGQTVPEPTTLALFGVGAAAIFGLCRRRVHHRAAA
jgi:hypothetical protein